MTGNPLAPLNRSGNWTRERRCGGVLWRWSFHSVAMYFLLWFLEPFQVRFSLNGYTMRNKLMVDWCQKSWRLTCLFWLWYDERMSNYATWRFASLFWGYVQTLKSHESIKTQSQLWWHCLKSGGLFYTSLKVSGTFQLGRFWIVYINTLGISFTYTLYL